MRKGLVAMIILALVAVLVAGCESATLPTPAPMQEPAPAPMTTPTVETGNFRFLISDDVNAIGEFQSLNITISKIGLQQGGESGNWTEPEDFVPVDVDLVPLQGDNATEIWSGNITPGEYTGVFIYVNVTEIRWQLNSNGDGATTDQENGRPDIQVTLPSEKLQILEPFTVNATGVVNFVYDVTVIKAGRSGLYIIKPELDQSGPDKPFNPVTSKGKPVKLGEVDEELELRLEGEPGLGAEVTLIVTDNGSAVVGANVTVNSEEVGSTDVDGRLPITLPDIPGEVQIVATMGDKVGELEVELEEDEEQPEWFEGTITAISEGEENASPWTMTLEGVEGTVTVYVTELEGTPSVGAKAKVEGILQNNTIEEAKAEIEEE